jgi:hypothetical protein
MPLTEIAVDDGPHNMGFRECFAHFVGVALVRYEGRRSCGNIRQCTELICADGRQHGDNRPFRTRACQFVSP